MNHLGLFEGIGGFSLAARWAGWHTVAWCEINPFGQQVLKYHFPNAKGYDDITKTDFTIHRGTVDIITGGFPCQPYSLAGKRLGKEDERHLWPEMLRAIREVQPRWVVGENVAGLINWSGGLVFEEVQTDLETEGYEVLAFVLPACGVDAPHRRDRVWFVAYASGKPSERVRLEQRSAGEPQQGQFGGDCGGVGDGFASNANIDRHTPSGESSKTQGVGSGNDGQQEVGCEPTERIDGLFGLQRFIANSQITRLQRQFQSKNSNFYIDRFFRNGQQWGYLWRKSPYTCIKRDAPNPSNKRLQRGKEQGGAGGIGQEPYEQPAGCVRPNWVEFPTQPPVCSRDDGFSARLDSITFSKWRSESVKAYGNAIVPQVAYNIFLTINEFENELGKLQG